MANPLVKLGQTGLDVSRIGLGCWQFSQKRSLAGLFWGFVSNEQATDIVRAALDGGVTWFDTAEAYGNGASERALAGALSECGVAQGDVVVATKWNPFLKGARSVVASIDDRKRYLAPYRIDLHQVHHPSSRSSIEKQMDAMAELVERGDIGHIGVSNFSASQMERCHRALERRGLALASNQVQYHLLQRRMERDGVLSVAKDIGATIIAYSPLAQGILTGRFHDDPSAIQKVRQMRRLSMRRFIAKSAGLVEVLKAIAEEVDATPAQVALAWTTQFHGDTVVAIPGASKVSQAQSNAASMEVALSDEQLARIDEAAR